MSTTVMAACWPLQMPPVPKSVLMSLADNANDHGACWPSLSTICLRTCYGRTAVIDAVRWLEANGFVVADRTNGRHTRYQVVPKLDLFPPAKPVRHADPSATRTGTPDEPHPSATRTGPVRHADTNRQEPSKAKDDSRGARLPDGWVPGDELKAWAAETHPNVDAGKAAIEFADYWRSVPGARGRRTDWDATFRNRVRELADRAVPIGVAADPPKRYPEYKPERRARGDPKAAPPEAVSKIFESLGITPSSTPNP